MKNLHDDLIARQTAAQRKSALAKQRREQRKAEHRCVICGAQDSRTLEGWTLCAQCREKNLECNRRGNYSMYSVTRKAKICFYCKKQDAYTLNGHTLCFECSEKRNAKRREKWKSDPEAARSKSRARYQERKEKGLCVICGRPMDRAGSICRRCNIMRNHKAVVRRVDAGEINWPRGDNGICWQCNKLPVVPGKKLCQSCLDKARSHLRPPPFGGLRKVQEDGLRLALAKRKSNGGNAL